MSAPKPGDRVRVTTTVEGRYEPLLHGEGRVIDDHGTEHIYSRFPDEPYSVVEVIAP